jgi:glycosyltransferase involved in cell wall biosynthesis
MSNPFEFVSIIMNARNAERYIKQAIDSVIAQSHGNWELIVLDNQSTDHTFKVVSAFNDSRIRLYQTDKLLPLGMARNLALSFVKGDFICFLDSDDLWETNKISEQLSIFEISPDLGMVYGNCWVINSSSTRLYKYNNEGHSGKIFDLLLTRNFINLQTVMINGRLPISGGLQLRDDLEVAEEYELFLRICYAHKVYYIDSPLASYRVHNEMTSLKKEHKFVEELELILEILPSYINDFESDHAVAIKKSRFLILYKKYRTLRKKSNYLLALKLLMVNFFKFRQVIILIPTLLLPMRIVISLEKIGRKIMYAN